MQTLSDEELMLSYQNGKAIAMEEIVARYKDPIYRFAFRLGQDAVEARDIAQEVFLRVHQYKDTYRPIAKFRTWIFSIAHNLCMSRLRKSKWLIFWPRKQDEPDELMDFPSPNPSPEEIASQDEVSNIIKENIKGLPFLQREALVLREYEKLDYQEISKILHKSLGTVKTLIHRARQNLKIKLLPYLEEFKGGYNE